MSPTDMASYHHADDIPEYMFPMYVIPEPPPKAEIIDAAIGGKEISA